MVSNTTKGRSRPDSPDTSLENASGPRTDVAQQTTATAVEPEPSPLEGVSIRRSLGRPTGGRLTFLDERAPLAANELRPHYEGGLPQNTPQTVLRNILEAETQVNVRVAAILQLGYEGMSEVERDQVKSILEGIVWDAHYSNERASALIRMSELGIPLSEGLSSVAGRDSYFVVPEALEIAQSQLN